MIWERTHHFDPRGAALADRHYSRRKPGSPQFAPPGERIVLVVGTLAVWVWWRPHPRSGLKAMNGRDGWTCTLFRNESSHRSSDLILEAERMLTTADTAGPCGPDGMMTYVWRAKVASANPGYCYKCAGWKRIGVSADGRKDLLSKPLALAGANPPWWPAIHRIRMCAETAFGPDTAVGGVAGVVPSAGHCAALAVIVRQRLGGDYVSAVVDGQSHWFNRIDGYDVDLTADQFARSPIAVAPAGELWPGSRLRLPEQLSNETSDRAAVLARRAGL